MSGFYCTDIHKLFCFPSHEIRKQVSHKTFIIPVLQCHNSYFTFACENTRVDHFYLNNTRSDLQFPHSIDIMASENEAPIKVTILTKESSNSFSRGTDSLVRMADRFSKISSAVTRHVLHYYSCERLHNFQQEYVEKFRDKYTQKVASSRPCRLTAVQSASNEMEKSYCI